MLRTTLVLLEVSSHFVYVSTRTIAASPQSLGAVPVAVPVGHATLKGATTASTSKLAQAFASGLGHGGENGETKKK